MMMSRPNKYLFFLPILGSYLHGRTEMTSFENDLFIYRWTIFLFVSVFVFILAKANQVLHCLLKN